MKDKITKRNKTPLKLRNPYAYYRNGWLGCKIGKYLSILTPFITIFAVNFNEYFVYVSEGEQVKMSTGCILACAIAGIAVWNEMRKKDDGTKNNQLTAILGWGIAFAFAFLFQTILQDLTLILGAGLLGQLAGLGFEIGASNRYYYMKAYRDKKIQSDMISQATKEAFGQLTGKHPPRD